MSTTTQSTIAAPIIAADPASPAHLATAQSMARVYADALIRALDDATEDRLSESGVSKARTSWGCWTEVAYGQDVYLDQSFDMIADALNAYDSLLDAESDAAGRRDFGPSDSWRDDVAEQLGCAASEARRLRDSYLVNPNTAEWTNRAWVAVDAAVQRQAVAA